MLGLSVHMVLSVQFAISGERVAVRVCTCSCAIVGSTAWWTQLLGWTGYWRWARAGVGCGPRGMEDGQLSEGGGAGGKARLLPQGRDEQLLLNNEIPHGDPRVMGDFPGTAVLCKNLLKLRHNQYGD